MKSYTRRHSNRQKFFKQFKQWICNATTIQILAYQVRVSPSTLRRYFHEYLDTPPVILKEEGLSDIHLKVDATYLKRSGCLIVCKTGSQIIYSSWHNSENLIAYLNVFSSLRKLGYNILSVTSDKHESIISAVRLSLNKVPHQYCAVHIQRCCESLLTRNPKEEPAIRLKEIVSQINKIKNDYEKNIWIKWFERFTQSYGECINHRTYSTRSDGRRTWWYTYGNLRKAYLILKHSCNNMFFYLENSSIPKDTNGLEAEFTHLKSKLRVHRGLTQARRVNFLYWYFHFKMES